MGPEIPGKELYREFRELKLRGRLTPPERVASLAVFLASDESASPTGKNGTESFYRKHGYEGWLTFMFSFC